MNNMISKPCFKIIAKYVMFDALRNLSFSSSLLFLCLENIETMKMNVHGRFESVLMR